KEPGSVMTAEFEVAGQRFVALNGGPHFKFNEAISFQVHCETQEEIDYFWSKLTEGGQEQPCGWLKDRYGVSWQVVPTVLAEMLSDPDPAKSQRVTSAFLPMKSLNTEERARAYKGQQSGAARRPGEPRQGSREPRPQRNARIEDCSHALRRWICRSGSEEKAESVPPHGAEGRQSLARA